MILWRHCSSKILSRLLDEMLDGEVQAAVRDHLVTCTECENRLKATAKVRQALKGLPVLEENPLETLQPPMFVPVIRPAFPVGGFVIGLVTGFLLLAGFLALKPIRTPMRVISAPTEGIEPEEAMRSLAQGDIDLEIPHQVLLRLKAGTTMTWEELNHSWIFGGRPNIVLNVMRGEVLARTQEKFWGSHLQIRTPTANAVVKGTALSVKVEPTQDATTLKVLAGSVFFTPYLGRVGMNVRAGQFSQIQGRKFPEPAKALSQVERKELLEAYRIGQDPQIALVIGGGPERAEDLLQPSLLYLSFQNHPELHPFVRKLVDDLNTALLQGNLSSQEKNVQTLEAVVLNIADPELAVPLRLYVGAYEVALGHVLRGRTHFRWVIEKAQHHPLASLALAALGTTAEKQLRNPELAQAAYQQLLSQYPKSPDASLAKEFLHRYSKSF